MLRALDTPRDRLAEHAARRRGGNLRNTSFSLIANDCWGGEAHRVLGLEYRSPFVGLMIMAPCYVRILADLPRALASEVVPLERSRYEGLNRMRPAWGDPYPIGLLADADAELHFLHYPTWEEATEKWRRRAARVDHDNLFVVLTADKGYCTDDTVFDFERTAPGRRLVIGARSYGLGHEVVARHYSTHAVELYRNLAPQFDVVDWLDGGPGVIAGRTRLLARRAVYGAWRWQAPPHDDHALA